MYFVVGTSTSEVRSVTNIPSLSWGTSHSGASNDLWGLSASDFTGQTNLDVCVYGVSTEGDFYLDYLSADITYSTGNYQTNYFGYDDDGNFVVQDQTTNRYPLAELDALSNQIAAIDGVDTNSFIAVSNRVAVIETNYAQLPDFIVISNLAVAVSNDVEIVKTNYVQLPDFTAHTNNESADILHFTAAEKLIATNQSPFQKFTATIEAVDGTATVTFAHGTLPEIHATNDTTITFDNTDYPTNGVNRVRIAVFAYTNAIGFDSTVINTNDFAPTFATNTAEDETALYFYRAVTNLWNGRY